MIKKLTFLLLFACMSNVSAQELSVFPNTFGVKYYQDDTEISRAEAKALLLKYDASASYWKKKSTNEILFYAAYSLSLGAAVWTGVESGRNRDDAELGAPVATTLGGFIISLIFLSEAKKNEKKAILTYNKQFDNPQQTSYRLIPVGNSNGIGLALKF